MRLRLFDRLHIDRVRRLARWPSGLRATGARRARQSPHEGALREGALRTDAEGRAASVPDSVGRHRRAVGAPGAPGATGYERGYDGAGIGVSAALQPPAGLRPRVPRPPRVPPPGGRAGGGAAGGGAGRARIREAPFAQPGPHLQPGAQLRPGAQLQYEAEPQYGAAPVESLADPATARPATARPASGQAASAQPARQPWYQVVTGPPPARGAAGRQRGLAAYRQSGQAQPEQAEQAELEQAQLEQVQSDQAQARPVAPGPRASRARLPRAVPHPLGHPPTSDGRRNCGALEKILYRQWEADTALPAQVITAIDRLAEFPAQLAEKLADGLDGIYIGPGGVPELDDMGALRGVPLPSGRATWDACAGAYGERKIVVGSRQSPTPDVMCHEVGHALDDMDSPQGKWQSDSAEFRVVYDLCTSHIVSDFHRQRGGLGRKEFFADAFAAIASGQRPALVDMLGGDTRTALRVMLYFNRRYHI